MNRAQELHQLGQSLWLDNITRDMLDDGTLRTYVDEFAVTGLTSNPTIFEKAIGNTDAYDEDIRDGMKAGKSEEVLFAELALEDLRRAADLFRPIFDATDGLDGWVSMEISPLLANDCRGSIDAAARIHREADRPNLYVKIPGTSEGIPAIEESIFNGVPVNVTLLFSREHYIAAAEAYLRGIERRIAAKRDPRVASVASLFISRWDTAVRRQGAARLARSARHCGRRSRVPRLSRAARIFALGKARRDRRTPATAPLGQHREQGSQGRGHVVRRGTGGPRYDRHHS